MDIALRAYVPFLPGMKLGMPQSSQILNKKLVQCVDSQNHRFLIFFIVSQASLLETFPKIVDFIGKSALFEGFVEQ